MALSDNRLVKAALGSPRCATHPPLWAASDSHTALQGDNSTAFVCGVAAGVSLKCSISLFYHLRFADKKGAWETFLFYIIRSIIPTAVSEPVDLIHSDNGFYVVLPTPSPANSLCIYIHDNVFKYG